MIKNSPNHDVKGFKDYPDFQNQKKIKSSSESKKSRFRQHKVAQGREISGLAAYE